MHISERTAFVALLLSRSSLRVFDDTAYRENRACPTALIYIDRIAVKYTCCTVYVAHIWSFRAGSGCIQNYVQPPHRWLGLIYITNTICCKKYSSLIPVWRVVNNIFLFKSFSYYNSRKWTLRSNVQFCNPNAKSREEICRNAQLNIVRNNGYCYISFIYDI